MHTPIVHCHPEPRSFNAALKDVAVETLQRRGHTVGVSDLYTEGYDPVEGPAHYADCADPYFFSALAEQRHGESLGTALPRYRVKKRSVLVSARRSALN